MKNLSSPWGIKPIVFLCLVLSRVSLAVDLTDTVFDKAGKQFDLDPLLIYSVALNESATGRGDGNVSPWAWALRAPNLPYYGGNYNDASKKLTEFLSNHGNSIDIGYMQVNYKWHRSRVKTPHDLLDPQTNILIGTEILKEAIASAPNDLTLGVGRYHRWVDEDKARSYGRRVLNIYKALKQI